MLDGLYSTYTGIQRLKECSNYFVAKNNNNIDALLVQISSDTHFTDYELNKLGLQIAKSSIKTANNQTFLKTIKISRNKRNHINNEVGQLQQTCTPSTFPYTLLPHGQCPALLSAPIVLFY